MLRKMWLEKAGELGCHQYLWAASDAPYRCESHAADWEFELATMGLAEDSWHLKTHR
jgi:hypothetical protein